MEKLVAYASDQVGVVSRSPIEPHRAEWLVWYQVKTQPSRAASFPIQEQFPRETCAKEKVWAAGGNLVDQVEKNINVP